MCQNFTLTKVTSTGRIAKFIANHCELTAQRTENFFILFFVISECTHSPWLPWNLIKFFSYRLNDAKLEFTTFNSVSLYIIHQDIFILIQTFAMLSSLLAAQVGVE